MNLEEKMKPILFSTEMVKAILEGRKTQTRRTKSLKHLTDHEYKGTIVFQGALHAVFVKDNIQTLVKAPYSEGGILWVRETWMNGPNAHLEGMDKYKYKASVSQQFIDECPGYWKPSIHMPRKACRLFLKVKSIRVERLQDITPSDAVDEGIEYWNIDKDALEGGELAADFKNYIWKDDPKNPFYNFPSFANCIESYKSLWQSINGEQSWNDNPFVWVIEFEKTDTYHQNKNSLLRNV